MPTRPPKHTTRSPVVAGAITRRESPSARGYDADWVRFRNWYAGVVPAVCADCGYAGESKRMHLDHITPLALGGDRLNKDNVQWLCVRCHSRKTTAEDGGFGGECRRFVITGPPASGKTTWVDKHRRDGDIVWDLDAVQTTMTRYPSHWFNPIYAGMFVAMRRAMVEYLRGRDMDCRVYVIVADKVQAEAVAHDLRAKVITMDVDAGELRRRLLIRAASESGSHVG